MLKYRKVFKKKKKKCDKKKSNKKREGVCTGREGKYGEAKSRKGVARQDTLFPSPLPIISPPNQLSLSLCNVIVKKIQKQKQKQKNKKTKKSKNAYPNLRVACSVLCIQGAGIV